MKNDDYVKWQKQNLPRINAPVFSESERKEIARAMVVYSEYSYDAEEVYNRSK